MTRRWRTVPTWMTLRRAVIAVVCFAVVNAISVELVLRTAHASLGHVHTVHTSHDTGNEAACVAAILDCHEYADDAEHEGNDGGPAHHQTCDHTHCIIAFVVPTSKIISHSLTGLRRARPANERSAGLRSPSFDRPPIARL